MKTATQTPDWISRLKAMAEDGRLDENSLDPALLLDLSESKVKSLKRVSNKNTRAASSGNTNLKFLLGEETAANGNRIFSKISSVADTNSVCLRYSGKRKLATKTEEALLNSFSSLLANSLEGTSGWLFVFDFCETELRTSQNFLENKTVVFHFPFSNLSNANFDVENKTKKILASNRTFPSSWSKVTDSEDCIAFASSMGEVGMLVNPFAKKTGSKVSLNAKNPVSEILKPVIEKIVERYETAKNSSRDTETDLIQAIDDIEVLRLLFTQVANDSVRSYQKTLDETERAKTNVRQGVDTMLAGGSKNKQILGQIQALRQTAEETGVNFDGEIKRLEDKLNEQQVEKTAQIAKVKNQIAVKKDLISRAELLRREMAGYRGQQLIRALTELTRIRQNRCVAMAKLKENKSSLWMDIVLHPIVMEHDRTRFLLDQLHFQIAVSDSNHIKIKWFWNKDDLQSPHPHVNSGGTTCWGEASSPIGDALSRNELSTAIRYITGWASQYNPASPYVRLLRSNFPVTDLAKGWHPELTDLSLI